MVRQICMYCKADIGTIEETKTMEETVSHGLCQRCLPKFLISLGKPFPDFLDSLPIPVFVVDENVRVISVNNLGQKFLSKNLATLQGCLGGQAFGCRYSQLPGGCGKTIHCKSCTIRRSVTETYATGKSLLRVPAYVDLGDLAGDATVHFLVSTQKIDPVVLLNIEDISTKPFATGAIT